MIYIKKYFLLIIIYILINIFPFSGYEQSLDNARILARIVSIQRTLQGRKNDPWNAIKNEMKHQSSPPPEGEEKKKNLTNLYSRHLIHKKTQRHPHAIHFSFLSYKTRKEKKNKISCLYLSLLSYPSKIKIFLPPLNLSFWVTFHASHCLQSSGPLHQIIPKLILAHFHGVDFLRTQTRNENPMFNLIIK